MKRHFLLIVVAFLLIAIGCSKDVDNNDQPDFHDTNSNEINPTVTIRAYYEEPGTWGSNTIVVRGLSEGEFIEIVVQGEILNFEHVEIVYNADTDMLEETDIINRFDKITNQTIVIKTTMPCTIPQEKIKWQSISGTDYEWIIQEDGVEIHGWEFILK